MKFVRVVTGPIRTIVPDHVAAPRIAQIDVTIGELDRDIFRHLVTHTRVERPSEAPLAGSIGISVALGAANRMNGHIAETADGVTTHADASADEGCEIVPGTEIDIGVRQERPLRFAAEIAVGRVSRSGSSDIVAVKVGATAIFAGEVEAQPFVEIVADAQAEQRG